MCFHWNKTEIINALWKKVIMWTVKIIWKSKNWRFSNFYALKYFFPFSMENVLIVTAMTLTKIVKSFVFNISIFTCHDYYKFILFFSLEIRTEISKGMILKSKFFFLVLRKGFRVKVTNDFLFVSTKWMIYDYYC